MRRYLYILSIICALLLMTACGGENQPDEVEAGKQSKPHYGDTFVYAIETSPKSLHPYIYGGLGSTDIKNLLFDSLIEFDAEGNAEPQLLESYDINRISNILYVHLTGEEQKTLAQNIIERFRNESSEFAPFNEIDQFTHWGVSSEVIIRVEYRDDVGEEEISRWESYSDEIDMACHRYEIDLKLRENIKWHDGAQFTSADVVYSYDLYMEPAYINKNSQYYVIEDIEKTGRFSMKFNLLKPYGNIMSIFTLKIAPNHILKDKAWNDAEYSAAPIGTGAFRFVEHIPDEYVLLERNDDYYDGKPYIEKVMFKIIPDKATQFLSLRKEEIDFMSFTFDQFKNYKNVPGLTERFNIVKLPWIETYLYVGYNCEKQFLDNLNVRKALTFAIDIDEIVEAVYFGDATRVTGPYRRTSVYYNDSIPLTPFDPERSRELLKKEGFVKGEDGILEKDGKQLRLSLTTSGQYDEFRLIVNMIKEYWRNIGVRVELKIEDYHRSKEMIQDGSVDTFFAGWFMGKIPYIFDKFHSSQFPEPNQRRNNIVRISDKEIDKLLEEVRYEMDFDTRVEIYKKLHELIYNTYSYAFMFSDDRIVVYNKRLHGLKPQDDGTFNPVKEWWVPEDMVKYK
ncbi:MAG: ABC transporter substrate-binding protein [Candidatus Muiribacteriaceae bacterium]